MRYSLEPRDRIYVKGYGFLFFAKNMSKSLSNKYGQKLLDSAKKSTTDAIKTASKRAVQITRVSKKKLAMELHSKELHNDNETDEEITTHKKNLISYTYL